MEVGKIKSNSKDLGTTQEAPRQPISERHWWRAQLAKCQFKSRSNSKCKDVAKCQLKSRSNSDAEMWINSKCTCVKLPLTCSETTLKLAVKRSSCDTTTAVRHPGLMADTANAVSVQRSSRQIKSKSTKDRRDCLSDRIRRRRNDDKFYGKVPDFWIAQSKMPRTKLANSKMPINYGVPYSYRGAEAAKQ